VLNSPLICFNYPDGWYCRRCSQCSASNISNFMMTRTSLRDRPQADTGLRAGYDQEVDAMVGAKYLAILNQLTASGALKLSTTTRGLHSTAGPRNPSHHAR
jgi:hypothetical protein